MNVYILEKYIQPIQSIECSYLLSTIKFDLFIQTVYFTISSTVKLGFCLSHMTLGVASKSKNYF